MNIVKNPAAAEEITQNTFVKAMTTKSEYEGSSSPYTWLCAIAKNQCYDYFRKNGRIADAVEPGTAGSGTGQGTRRKRHDTRH